MPVSHGLAKCGTYSESPVSLTLSASSMSFAPEAPDSNGLKHVATVVSGLVVAFLTTAILIPMVQPRPPVRPAGVIAKAMAVTLVVAAVTVSTVWLASFLAGIRSDQRVRAAAAFTSVWFIPLIVFGDQRSLQVVEAWIGISIQFACLGVLLSNTIPSLPTGGGHQPPQFLRSKLCEARQFPGTLSLHLSAP